MNNFSLQANIPSGAKAHVDSVDFLRGLKPPPPSVLLTSFSPWRVQLAAVSQDWGNAMPVNY
jgi:hypothetical protein